jgi:processive 1,2-diacylglycerol beta-glucosyltransferase
MRKVLIISSDYTGHGHKSITESLCEQYKSHLAYQIRVVDGFLLGGKALLNIGKLYGSITRNAENLWKIVWRLSSSKPTLVNKIIEELIKDSFIKLLDEVKPDVILSVHPNYNGSILNILEKQHKKIPFITFIADLVNINPLWVDIRADYIISPTIEAREKCIEYGFPVKKIKVLGFPVRSIFFKNNNNQKASYKKGQSLIYLIMSGGEGVGNMEHIAENLLDNFDCEVKIIAGRNVKLKARLEHSLKSKYGDKVEIYGFTKNIQDLMFTSDVVVTRGSPNVMFEAIASNTPLIITGALPGQEQDNPAFVEKLNLGIICKSPNEIKHTVIKLLENNGKELINILHSQRDFIHSNAAEDIMNFILKMEESDYNTLERDRQKSDLSAAPGNECEADIIMERMYACEK